MLNKHTLGVTKVQGQSEATCKQAGVTRALVSAETKKLFYQVYFSLLE